jgi:hypothetical protein
VGRPAACRFEQGVGWASRLRGKADRPHPYESQRGPRLVRRQRTFPSDVPVATKSAGRFLAQWGRHLRPPLILPAQPNAGSWSLLRWCAVGTPRELIGFQGSVFGVPESMVTDQRVEWGSGSGVGFADIPRVVARIAEGSYHERKHTSLALER